MACIKQHLEKLGKTDICEFSYNGEELLDSFIALIKNGTPVSHILTDYMMPRLNGIQTISRIK